MPPGSCGVGMTEKTDNSGPMSSRSPRRSLKNVMGGNLTGKATGLACGWEEYCAVTSKDVDNSYRN